MEKARNWFEDGVIHFEKENYSSAITAFDKAISLNQNPVDAWCNRGLAFAQMGQYEQALASFDKTLLLESVHENARKARAMVLERIAKQERLARTPDAVIIPPDTYVEPPAPVAESAAPETSPSPVTEQIRTPILAAIFSCIFPGWGQWYDGKRWAGLLFLGASVILVLSDILLSILLKRNILVSSACMVLALVLWFYGMYHAYKTAERINLREIGFTRKSRLFWLPVALLVITVVLLILALVLTFMVFGVAGNIHHTKVVAATAQQPDATHIIVTCQGGQDTGLVSQVFVTVTDHASVSQTKSLGDPQGTPPVREGSSVTFTGSYDGKDHVVATAKFRDGTDQVILDTYM